jgi:hypothetical protein
MAPWVQRIFIEFLPKLLCIQRPKKEDEPQEVEEQPPEVLTDVFHVPPDVEKYSPFCTNKYSTDFDIPGEWSSILDFPLARSSEGSAGSTEKIPHLRLAKLFFSRHSTRGKFI